MKPRSPQSSQILSLDTLSHMGHQGILSSLSFPPQVSEKFASGCLVFPNDFMGVHVQKTCRWPIAVQHAQSEKPSTSLLTPCRSFLITSVNCPLFLGCFLTLGGHLLLPPLLFLLHSKGGFGPWLMSQVRSGCHTEQTLHVCLSTRELQDRKYDSGSLPHSPLAMHVYHWEFSRAPSSTGLSPQWEGLGQARLCSSCWHVMWRKISPFWSSTYYLFYSNMPLVTRCGLFGGPLARSGICFHRRWLQRCGGTTKASSETQGKHQRSWHHLKKRMRSGRCYRNP